MLSDEEIRIFKETTIPQLKARITALNRLIVFKRSRESEDMLIQELQKFDERLSAVEVGTEIKEKQAKKKWPSITGELK